MCGIRFGDVKLLTDATVAPASDIDVVKIERLNSRAAYSRFMLKDLRHYIDTDYVLVVQWDGFVINPTAWSSSFLDYDYIGAIWPQFDQDGCVGNGGFSLRSRKLLTASATLPHDDALNEDLAICRVYREQLEGEYGIRFADRSTASRFAYERTPSLGHEFGFHGFFNMPRVLDTEEFRAFYTSVDLNIINKQDHLDLIFQALRSGNSLLARIVINRHLQTPARWPDLAALAWRAIAGMVARLVNPSDFDRVQSNNALPVQSAPSHPR